MFVQCLSVGAAESVDAVQRAADNIIQQKDHIIEWYVTLLPGD